MRLGLSSRISAQSLSSSGSKRKAARIGSADAEGLISEEALGAGTEAVTARAPAMDVKGHGKTNGSKAEELLEGAAIAEKRNAGAVNVQCDSKPELVVSPEVWRGRKEKEKSTESQMATGDVSDCI